MFAQRSLALGIAADFKMAFLERLVEHHTWALLLLLQHRLRVFANDTAVTNSLGLIHLDSGYSSLNGVMTMLARSAPVAPSEPRTRIAGDWSVLVGALTGST